MCTLASQDFNDLVEMASKGNRFNVDNHTHGMMRVVDNEVSFKAMFDLPDIGTFRFGSVVGARGDKG